MSITFSLPAGFRLEHALTRKDAKTSHFSVPIELTCQFLQYFSNMSFDVLSITNIIVGVTCLVSYVALQNLTGKAQLIFHPVTIREHHQWYRFLTSGFVHADLTHLVINMFVLWSFGNAIESFFYPGFLGEFSAQKFVALYFGGIAVSSIPSYLRHKRNPRYAALGCPSYLSIR
jgi:membrane associated rhomboid family serine protease